MDGDDRDDGGGLRRAAADLLANAAELVSGWGIVATAVWLPSRHCGRPEEYAASDEFRRRAASE
ncbi:MULTISPECIES: hypothetical protein [Nocardia]|uniref:hypothetical protein n=1 Tax=Nocardia TaxID=1817 RepID=UPI001895B3C4|nr:MULTISPECIES: hypothetical protein [Nocardia]MBF6351619.1 hypothetical protein [Nocardia flavorosea]